MRTDLATLRTDLAHCHSQAGPDPHMDGGSGPTQHFNLGSILMAWVSLVKLLT